MAIEVDLKKNIGKSGRASVKVLRDVIRVAFEDDSGIVREFPRDSAPDKVFSGDSMMVTLSVAEDGIFSIRPASGEHPFLFSHFTRDEDDDEIIFTDRDATVRRGKYADGPKKGKTWKIEDPARRTLTAILVIASGPYEGAEFPVLLDDLWTRGKGGMAKLSGLAKFAGFTMDVLQAAGIDFQGEDEFPLSGTIWDEIEDVLKDRGQIFRAELNGKGWIRGQSFKPAKVGEEAARKRARKSAKKSTRKTTKKSTKKTATRRTARQTTRRKR